MAAKTEIYALIRELAASGMSLVLVSSELPKLLALSERIIVICEGRIAGELQIQPISEEEEGSEGKGGPHFLNLHRRPQHLSQSMVYQRLPLLFKAG